MIFAVLATGPSMSQELAWSVRGRVKVVAVSDAYKLAPWADALVSTDAGWWRHHQPAFAGRKFSVGWVPDVEQLHGVETGSNSGLAAVKAAVMLGATRVLMLGFDMKGSHFFGPHPAPLRNPRPERFNVFRSQFDAYRPRGVTIINCTPDSALDCYPKATLESELARLA